MKDGMVGGPDAEIRMSVPALSLRGRVLVGGAVFFGVLFAAIALGVVQTAQIVDERRGPPPAGPEEWMLAATVSGVPSNIQHIFSFTAAPMSHAHHGWFGNASRKVRLFTRLGTQPSPEYEYIPHVIAFDNVPGDAVEPADLDKLVEYEEEGLVGLVFFAGEFFSGGGRYASWSESPIANLIPVTIVEEEPVTGIEAEMRIEDRKFPPFEGFDFSTLRIHTINKVILKPGAKVAASVKLAGETHPLLVWWEVNGAKIIVWTGSFDDIYDWKTDEFWTSQGKEGYGRAGGPYFARKIVYFAANRRADEKPVT